MYNSILYTYCIYIALRDTNSLIHIQYLHKVYKAHKIDTYTKHTHINLHLYNQTATTFLPF